MTELNKILRRLEKENEIPSQTRKQAEEYGSLLSGLRD